MTERPKKQKKSLSSVQEYFDCPCWLLDIADVFLSPRSNNVVKKIENINSNASLISVLFFHLKILDFRKKVSIRLRDIKYVVMENVMKSHRFWSCPVSIYFLTGGSWSFGISIPDESIGRKAITRK